MKARRDRKQAFKKVSYYDVLRLCRSGIREIEHAVKVRQLKPELQRFNQEEARTSSLSESFRWPWVSLMLQQRRCRLDRMEALTLTSGTNRLNNTQRKTFSTLYPLQVCDYVMKNYTWIHEKRVNIVNNCGSTEQHGTSVSLYMGCCL